MSQCGISFVYA